MSLEDQASDREFMDRELALQQRKPTRPVPCGQCYNCGEMLSGVQRWCDGECLSDWQFREGAR